MLEEKLIFLNRVLEATSFASVESLILFNKCLEVIAILPKEKNLLKYIFYIKKIIHFITFLCLFSPKQKFTSSGQTKPCWGVTAWLSLS